MRLHLKDRASLARALRTALLVGPILTLINQPDVVFGLFDGRGPAPSVWMRIALTFIVPFLVSLVSSALADRNRSRSPAEGGARHGDASVVGIGRGEQDVIL